MLVRAGLVAWFYSFGHIHAVIHQQREWLTKGVDRDTIYLQKLNNQSTHDGSEIIIHSAGRVKYCRGNKED